MVHTMGMIIDMVTSGYSYGSPGGKDQDWRNWKVSYQYGRNRHIFGWRRRSRARPQFIGVKSDGC